MKDIKLFITSVAFLVVIVLLSSCTTKIVSRPADDTVPAVGISYHLPATELSYVMTFRLTDSLGTIEITDAAVEQKIVPDKAAGTYLIDSSSLSNLSKTIPLAKITINNGMLASISYDAKDSTADIIKSSVTLLADAASNLLPVKLPSLGGALMLLSGSRSFQLSKSQQESETTGKDICNQETKRILDEYNFLLQHMSTVKRKLYEAEIRLVEKRDGMPEKIQDIENVIRKTKERLAELDKHLTIQYRRPLIIESGKCDSFGDITLESSPFTKWFGNEGNNNVLGKQFQMWIEENKLSYTISNCSSQVKDQDKKTVNVEGLYYRIPAICKLEITKDTLVSTNYVEVMQCGRLAVVEITNGAFQNNSHRLEFDPLSGEIKSFEFKDNTVRSSEALGTVTEIIKKAGQ
ncbi:MAG: hypothetical protein AB2L12_16265 [Smithellaceae bacterium]